MFNNKLISNSSNMFAFRSYLEKLYITTKEVQETRQISEGFVND